MHLSFGHLCFTSSPQTSNFKYALHQSSGRLSFINSFPISKFKYVLHLSFGRLCLVIFPFLLHFFRFLLPVSFLICLYFYCYLFVFHIVICLCFYCYLLVFLLSSACVSLIFCCLYVGRHTTCTTAVVQFVPQSSYNVYYGRRTLSKSTHSMHY